MLAAAACVLAAAPEAVVVQLWCTIGLATFAALFALLMLRPLRWPALWVLLSASKAALVLVGALLSSATPGAGNLLLWDGLLCLLLVAGTVVAVCATRRAARVRRANNSFHFDAGSLR